MTMNIGCAPCCWGVDDLANPHILPWSQVLAEAAEAGYKGIELGPYGYLPLDVSLLRPELERRRLGITAGTIFDDLVSAENMPKLLRQARDICALLKQLHPLPGEPGQRFPLPYLVVIDWGHPERDCEAGHSDRAPRLSDERWTRMMEHIRCIAEVARDEFGVRAVIHPHAGSYIEFADEIDRVAGDIPTEVAGLCLDTGHLYYAGMDPAMWLRRHALRLDYVHFKDINPVVFGQIMHERITFFAACSRGVMCPIGKGVLDYPAVKTVLEECGYAGYITIEQERDPRNARSTLHDLAASRAFLAAVGFA